jgi:hypothetical protein
VGTVAGDIDRIFGFHLGRKDLPDPSDCLVDQMEAFRPLCGHFGILWPTRKTRQFPTWCQAFARAAPWTKRPG